MNDSLEQGLKAGGGFEAQAAQAAARFAARAEEAGVLDVAYATVDGPFGEMVVAGTRRGLVRLAWSWSDRDAVLVDLAARLSPRVLKAPGRLDPVRRQLEEYFDGRRRQFELPIDWSLTRGFTRKVLQATNRVPFGELTTYAAMATGAGSPRAVRAAGSALGANPIPIVVPCHRVVRTGGAIGGYGGGLDTKRTLLAIEGHPSI